MSLASAHKFTSMCTPTPTHSYVSHTHGHTNTHTLEGSYKTRGWTEIRRLEKERMDSGVFRIPKAWGAVKGTDTRLTGSWRK